MANEKRLEELKYATAKLKALTEAMIVVHGDSTARELLERVLTEGTFDGTQTHVEDLHNAFMISLAHGMVATTKETIALKNAAAPEGAAA